MGAPQPAPNRLPPEVSPVFLGDTIKYFQLPMSQASPGSSRPGHCVAHWTSAPCVLLTRNLQARTASFTHTLCSPSSLGQNLLLLQVLPSGDCSFPPATQLFKPFKLKVILDSFSYLSSLLDASASPADSTSKT